ncbi:hypothetical protein C4587_00395 [Candidatus Parcubacteria bacterium]|nr:MAG: hypothetical protein C4587_00395 [Candidatus Parcubacteria bacterium]
MLFGFVDSQSLFTLLHLFGVVIGAGGAFASDLIFLSSINDERISPTEMRFLRLGSKMVWGGLFLIAISGIFLFAPDSARYLASSKFLAKMTIVAVIILNGLFFHLSHIPRLHRHVGSHFPSSDEFVRKSSLLTASGVISLVSWSSAVVLGALRDVPFSYGTIMAVYAAALGVGVGIGIVFQGRIFGIRR